MPRRRRSASVGLARAAVVFVPIYRVWVGTTLVANIRDVARPSLRLQMFAVSLTGFFMALAAPHAYEDRGLLLAVAYWTARLTRGLPFLRSRTLSPLNALELMRFNRR